LVFRVVLQQQLFFCPIFLPFGSIFGLYFIPFFYFYFNESCCRWAQIPFFYFILTESCYCLKLKSFPFSIFILGHAVLSSSHSLFSIFYSNGSVAELNSFLVCRFGTR
jgi:hypothetical protein